MSWLANFMNCTYRVFYQACKSRYLYKKPYFWAGYDFFFLTDFSNTLSITIETQTGGKEKKII